MMVILANIFAVAATNANAAQPCDPALIRQIVQELALSNTAAAATFNCHCSCNDGGYTSYLLPVAALVGMAMGLFFYIWWKGFISSARKRLGNLIERIAPTERCLTEKVEALSLKVDEQNELIQLNANDVSEVKSGLSQIGGAINSISEKIPRMEGELKLAESKQDMTISRVRRLGKSIFGLTDRNRNISEEVSTEQGNLSSLGLQTISTEGSSSTAIIQKQCQINIPQDGETIG